MISELLQKAREYELIHGNNISIEDRPKIHLSSRVGWMNDPNGFSIYKDEYHLFYQYYPYEAKWGPMHWAHAVSKDLLTWEYRPVVLAPDKEYDSFGCFSGTAITKDNQHLLMYTNVKTISLDNGKKREIQEQSIAIGDGVNYEKHIANPVISSDQIPEGFSIFDFRDPKIWLGSDGIYRVLIGGMDENQLGTLLLYISNDCINWTFKKIFARNDGRFGRMWECPDFFILDGKGVIIVSPTDMQAEGCEYRNGNDTLCLIGKYDEVTDDFVVENTQSIDYGIDFYAPESLETKDGRRVMIGWMQNWDTISEHDVNDPFFGQMTLPRELHIKDGRLYQKPISELDKKRLDPLIYNNVILNNKETTLEGVLGRVLELDVEISPVDKNALFDSFCISFAKGDKNHTDFIYRPKESIVEFDRRYSGSRRSYMHQSYSIVKPEDGRLKARFILDNQSIEVFLEDGREAMTITVNTPLEDKNISFSVDGMVRLNIVKYEFK